MESQTKNVHILLGSNLGNRVLFLNLAKDLLKEYVGDIVGLSSIYETEAWGKTDQPSFLNQLIVYKTDLCPEKLLECCLTIEKDLGRERIEKWGSRIIDIDILYYENQIVSTKKLKIPHPEIQNRRFVLTPLVEICNDFIHPKLHKTQKLLLLECKDNLTVKKYKI